MSILLLGVDGLLYPGGEVGHLGVDAVLALAAAPLAKRGDPVDRPAIVLLAQQRATWRMRKHYEWLNKHNYVQFKVLKMV